MGEQLYARIIIAEDDRLTGQLLELIIIGVSPGSYLPGPQWARSPSTL